MKTPEMGGLLPEQAEKKRYTIALKKGGSITVEEAEPGIFRTVSSDIANKDGDSMTDMTDIGFERWDDSVKDLDNGCSDISQCLSMSEHLQWKEVELTPYEIKAPSLDRLKKALQHIDITSYYSDEI